MSMGILREALLKSGLITKDQYDRSEKELSGQQRGNSTNTKNKISVVNESSQEEQKTQQSGQKEKSKKTSAANKRHAV